MIEHRKQNDVKNSLQQENKLFLLEVIFKNSLLEHILDLPIAHYLIAFIHTFS